MSAVHAVGVTVRYADQIALRSLDLELAPGSVLAVTGPSGAGKSTLVWALAGATPLAAGEVRVGGTMISDREVAARLGVAVVPQGNGLASTLTAAENVLVPLLAAGVAARDAERRTREAMTSVGLEESGNHLIEELSGGQQQRVALARAFAARAAVLLVDEPTSDLDSANRDRVISVLRAQAAAGAVVVMTTHDPEAAAQADGELHLDEGVASWVRQLPVRPLETT